MADPLRIGILSTAAIGAAVCKVAEHMPNVEIVAVSSRNLDKAGAFAAKHGIPISCSYDELLTKSDVEAVYVPMPTALATAWAVKAAKAGKHVLVDKPFDSADGVRQIVAACNETGVAFLDATHFMYSKRFAEVRQELHKLDPDRPPKRVSVSYSMPMEMVLKEPGAIRVDPSLEPGGALGDLGWYNCRLFVALVGAEACEHVASVHCVAEEHPDFPGFIARTEGVLKLENGSTLLMDVDANGPIRQCFTAANRAGSVRVVDYVLPETNNFVFSDMQPEGENRRENGYDVERSGVILEDGAVGMTWPERWHVNVEEGGHQAVAMLREFEAVAHNKEGAMKSREAWAKESIAAQSLLDMFLTEAKKSIAAFRASEKSAE